jgi:hypothetical protein
MIRILRKPAWCTGTTPCTFILLCTAIFLSKTSSLVAAEASTESKTQALFAQWKPRFDEEKLHAVVASPFVVAGDSSEEKLGLYRDGTVLAAAHALQAMYFEKPLKEPVLIFLFESEEPYKRLAKKWFDQDNVPHFGFYRHADHVMFMNVATGTGTLVHELTHALIAPDFPGVPSWFNEGLASLYEQCSISGNTITGHENWRLPNLQKAIREKTLRPLKELIEDPNFYRRDLVGINYAQARYLMLYLQQKQLLQPYYRRFRSQAGDDPAGLKSLEQIVAPQALDQFEKEWRDWVLTLQFR